MKEPNYNAPGPIRGLLDEFARMPEGRRTFVAGMLAVVLHAVVFLGGGLAIFRLQQDHPPTKPPEKKRSQLEVTLYTPTPPPKLAAATPTPEPELITPQEAMQLAELFRLLPEEIQQEYVDVDGLAQKKNLSKRALLESWADSVAGSRLPGKGEGPLPSQMGKEMPFTSFKDQQVSLGKEKTPAEADLDSRLPQLPTNPADIRPIFQPQPIPREALAPTTTQRPIPKVAEVAKVRPKDESAAPTPAPSRLLLAKATTPPPIKKVREASPDEIPMFLNQPEQKVVPDVNLRPEPPPEPLRPKPVPTPEPKPEPTPEPAKPQPTPAPNAKPVPKPPVREAISIIVAARLPNQTRPQPVSNPGYAPHQVQTQIQGGSAPPGDNGVDAAATISGKYKKGLNTTIGSRWTFFVNDPKFSSLVSAGQTTVQFTLDARGKIVRIKVTDNTSNSAHAQLCERAFFDSQRDLDPPPAEVLRNGVYEDSFTFVLY